MEALKVHRDGRHGTNNMASVTLRSVRNVALVTGLLAGSAFAAQGSLSDAQVEANVLKALAGAPELAHEAIQTRTVYGTVTLTGSIQNEALRQRAETLASTANGVKKVVDELALGQMASNQGRTGNVQAIASADQPAKLVLQSDGTYAPAEAGNAGQQPMQGQRNDPDADQALDRQMEQQQAGNNGQAAPSATGGQVAGGYPAPNQGYPAPNQGYPAPNQGYPGGYPAPNQGANPGYPATPAAPGYPASPNMPRSMNPPYPQYGQAPYGNPYAGQTGGQVVTIPANALLQVRINRSLSSNSSQPGQMFTGVMANDVIAGNAVAIPRGAAVQGTVLNVDKAGVLKGRGEMSLQLTQVTLGGKVYPVASDVWDHHGGDKTLQSINSTAVGGGLGALVGAAAGGGVGAAIGAGVGGAIGLGSSAASGGGQVYVPAEAMLTFHLATPATVTTVDQQEMQRLAYGVPAGGPPGYYPPRRRIYPYPYPYYVPGYYRPYAAYPYPY